MNRESPQDTDNIIALNDIRRCREIVDIHYRINIRIRTKNYVEIDSLLQIIPNPIAPGNQHCAGAME